VAWIGDGNNMCQSYINAACLLGFKLNIACPKGYEPETELYTQAASAVNLTHDPRAAAENADLIVTDVWASMGDEAEAEQRLQDFDGYIVNSDMMKLANADALFMHCLPAHRGEEVAAEVIDGPQSVVWDEAENRLHAQKALLEFLLVG
ncbi:MAG: ornithine carbamoyltransferase, partial [Salinisphaeraceae bacterium]|nr:ornithine carbamoyltransferase [Salinisphaeraceae bacterium]